MRGVSFSEHRWTFQLGQTPSEKCTRRPEAHLSNSHWNLTQQNLGIGTNQVRNECENDPSTKGTILIIQSENWKMRLPYVRVRAWSGNNSNCFESPFGFFFIFLPFRLANEPFSFSNKTRDIDSGVGKLRDKGLRRRDSSSLHLQWLRSSMHSMQFHQSRSCLGYIVYRQGHGVEKKKVEMIWSCVSGKNQAAVQLKNLSQVEKTKLHISV